MFYVLDLHDELKLANCPQSSVTLQLLDYYGTIHIDVHVQQTVYPCFATDKYKCHRIRFYHFPVKIKQQYAYKQPAS